MNIIRNNLRSFPHIFPTPISSPVITSIRKYTHWKRTFPEDFGLPHDTIPENISEMLEKNPKEMDFFENYWFWRLRSESSILNSRELCNISYTKLAKDMGMPIINQHDEHHVGLLELYEYLKSAPFVGPFGTLQNPVIVPSVHTERYVACTGGTGDNEHVPLWFRCKEGFLYRCGECDQIFMLVRVMNDFDLQFQDDENNIIGFDSSCIEKIHSQLNSEYIQWPLGDVIYRELFLEGKWNNKIPVLTTEQPHTEALNEHMR